MRDRLSRARDPLALLLMFVVFLFAVYHFKQAGNEALPPTAPSTLNAAPPGAKALFLLLRRYGYRVDRLEAGWRSLTPNDGLVIVIEPLMAAREPSSAEVKALRDWVERGGTVYYSVTTPPRPLDPSDPLGGDLAIHSTAPADEAKTDTLSVKADASPILQDVHRITVNCPVRLQPAVGAGYTTLTADPSGAVIVQKSIGRGHLIVAADLNLTNNAAILEEDNAQLMVNIVAAAVGSSGRNVLFDEYHHGAGFDGNEGQNGGGLLANTPLPLRLTLLHLAGLAGLIIYNGNRRFGAARRLAPSPQRANTDYIRSMARLYRRSRSADIALMTLATAFRRNLARHLELPPDAPDEQIIALVQSRYAADAGSLGTLLQRCARIDAGERIAEPELLALTRQIQDWQRRLQLVGD
jgi:hypothetical protein